MAFAISRVFDLPLRLCMRHQHPDRRESDVMGERVYAAFRLEGETELRGVPILRASLAWEWVESLREDNPEWADRLLKQMVHERLVLEEDES